MLPDIIERLHRIGIELEKHQLWSLSKDVEYVRKYLEDREEYASNSEAIGILQSHLHSGEEVKEGHL